MDGSPDLKNAGPAQTYSGPPDYRVVGRHGVFPETTHDEIARLNFLAHMNRHLATRVMPAVKTAWERRAGPAFETREGRPPKDRHEVRKALLNDPYYQAWSALRRATMEQRQQAGRWTALRQAETLAAKVEAFLQVAPLQFADAARALGHHQIADYQHLMQRVDAAKVEALITPPAPPAPPVVHPGGEAIAAEQPRCVPAGRPDGASVL